MYKIPLVKCIYTFNAKIKEQLQELSADYSIQITVS